MQKYKKILRMKLIEILNLNRELLIYFQKAGIRLDDVQYIDLFNEYRTLSAQGEKVSYIVARPATEYAVSLRAMPCPSKMSSRSAGESTNRSLSR